MIEDKEMEYVNVPTYIEKALKKIIRQKLYVKNILIRLEEYFLKHKTPSLTEEEVSDLMDYIYLLEEYINV